MPRPLVRVEIQIHRGLAEEIGEEVEAGTFRSLASACEFFTLVGAGKMWLIKKENGGRVPARFSPEPRGGPA